MNARQSDFEWLQQFARAGNQSAFRDLVRRHIDLVLATALRKVGDAGGAEEISQNVFGVLAKKAWQFAPDDSLPAWLHKTTLLESQAWQRGELRRRRREQAAAELGTTMKTPDEQPAFHALVPLLDEALLSLREKDREALLLRFYESQSLKDVGAALGVSDDTAQKRVTTALEKLSHFFQRRGFKTATVAATTAALQHTASSASAATVSLVFNAALQAAPPALVGLGALLARFASLTKLQTAAVCLAIAAGPAAWQINEVRTAQSAAMQVRSASLSTQTELAGQEQELETFQLALRRMEEATDSTRESAKREAHIIQQWLAWKAATRQRLLGSDYNWPADLPFVRIRKVMLPEISAGRVIQSPGTLSRSACELLGLTRPEREQLETAVQAHITRVAELMAEHLTVTNQPTRAPITTAAIAQQVWTVSPLDESMQDSVTTLLATGQNILQSERWQIVSSLMDESGFGSLRQDLLLDGDNLRQELAAWVYETGGKLMVGCSWAGDRHGGGYMSTTCSPMELGWFASDAPELDRLLRISRMETINFLPGNIRERAVAWLTTKADNLKIQEAGK